MESIADRTIAHLKAKWQGKSCPMCAVGPWEVQETVFGLTAFTPGYIQPGLPTLPMIPITCRNCGYTAFVNAKSAGIVEDEELATYRPTPTPIPTPMFDATTSETPSPTPTLKGRFKG